jgi:hypothetical protein
VIKFDLFVGQNFSHVSPPHSPINSVANDYQRSMTAATGKSIVWPERLREYRAGALPDNG